jgi:putative sterol carrier protein
MTEELSADQITPTLVFETMPQFLNKDKAAGVNATIQFDLSGDGGGQWWVKIADGEASSGQGTAENPNLTLLADAQDYVKISLGQLDGTAAFMQGKLKIKGDMGLAIKMQSLFNRPEL